MYHKKVEMRQLIISDDLYTWFKHHYKQTKEPNTYVTIKQIYETFTISDFYANLTKPDKRKYSLSYFKAKVITNVFLKNFVKKRDEFYLNKQLKKDIVIGWKEKLYGEDDED